MLGGCFLFGDKLYPLRDMKRWLIGLGLIGLIGHAWAQEPRKPEETVRRGAEASLENEAAPVEAVGGLPTCTARELPFKGGAGKTVIRIDVHDTIDLGLSPFISRVIEEAEEDGVALILLHMNTPGGRLDAAQDIKDALLKSKVPTATFIDTHALSAGALIAYATDFIIVTDGSTMGAATPINVSSQGEAQAVGEKFVSAVRAIFESTAQAKGRDGTLAEAMVDKDVEIAGLIEKGKLLTLAKDDLMKWCVADYTARDVPELLEVLNLSGAKVEKRELNWAEKIARVLTDPTVSSMLMTFGFLGLMLELYTAGFGISGIIGLSCLFLFFFGHAVVNLVGIEELLLLMVGLGLLIAEVFFIPGFGVAGVVGLLCVVASVSLAMVGQDIAFSWEVGALPDALARVGLSFVMTMVIFLLASRYLPETKLFNRLVLQTAVDGDAFTEDATDASSPAEKAPDLTGSEGIAITRIRGSGKARIGDETYDVVGRGEPIDQGQWLVVVSCRPGQIVVAPKGSV